MQPERMTISLPPCTCGRQTFLKAHFTPEELQAPNMIDSETKQLTESHAYAMRTMAMARQMIAAGKTPPPT